jgi:hypothetical protein
MMGEGIWTLSAYLPMFGIAVAMLIAILVVGHIVIAAMHPEEAGVRDERDRWIDWKAGSRSSFVVGTGVLGALAGLFAGWHPVWIAHILLHTLFIAELAKLGFQLFYYRRGI